MGLCTRFVFIKELFSDESYIVVSFSTCSWATLDTIINPYPYNFTHVCLPSASSNHHNKMTNLQPYLWSNFYNNNITSENGKHLLIRIQWHLNLWFYSKYFAYCWFKVIYHKKPTGAIFVGQFITVIYWQLNTIWYSFV